jgi:hypothetical protein
MSAQTDPPAGQSIEGLLAQMQAAAQEAAKAESAFKRGVDGRIAELEQARAFAYRRMGVMTALCSVAPEGEYQACVQARLKALFVHVGWIDGGLEELDATEREVRDALLPVAGAIEDLARSAPPSAADALPALSPIELFAVFEAWYRGRFACEFLDVFEQRAAFRPLTDF